MSVASELERFDPAVPLEEASTPPASWYTDREFLELERRTVFRRTWQAVARTDQLGAPGDFVSGDLAGEPWLALRDSTGERRAFLNVCRHHAAQLVEGCGQTDSLVCPYHGWVYDLDGRLRKAPRLGGIRDFDRQRHGLLPLELSSWGPLVFVRLQTGGLALQDLLQPLDSCVDLQGLRFVARRSWELRCNWKVFVDNYLDGGYHVDALHRGLASQLDLDSYRNEIHGDLSLQVCRSGDDGSTEGLDFVERVGDGAVYAFVHPNLMINRYGPILDTNWIVPLSHDRTLTVFDYWFAEELADNTNFVERSLQASARVQEEDVAVCESVQRGLASSGFDRGRYAMLEEPAHHFHRLLARDLRAQSA